MSDSLQVVRELAANPVASTWFAQVLSYLRVHVEDTGEDFTVTADGQRVEVHPGIVPFDRKKVLFGLFDPGEWYAKQFVLKLNSEHVRNFAAYFADDEVTPEELYHTMRFLTPVLLNAALEIPAMRNPLLLNLLGLETYWQQALLDPEGNVTEPHTVQLIGSEWQILPGFHGTPRRRKLLTPEKLLEFQRRTHEAEVEDTLQGWFALLGWYKQWLDTVSVPVPAPDPAPTA